jgi:hypothetical protein
MYVSCLLDADRFQMTPVIAWFPAVCEMPIHARQCNKDSQRTIALSSCCQTQAVQCSVVIVAVNVIAVSCRNSCSIVKHHHIFYQQLTTINACIKTDLTNNQASGSRCVVCMN